MSDDAFYLRVAHALSGCQLVEMELKLYITEAYDLVRKRLAGVLPFKASGGDFDNAPLERLIKVFGQLSDNESLVRELDKFKNERNFLSHRAIASCVDPDGQLSVPERDGLMEYDGRLDSIQVNARTLREAIHLEANKFRGHLYFDDLTKGGA